MNIVTRQPRTGGQLNTRRVVLLLLTIFTSTPLISAPWRIMPVGNSITLGRGDEIDPTVGFRDDLYNLLQGYIPEGFELVGSDGSAPYQGFFRAGAKISDFSNGGIKELSTEIAAQRPDILLIHLGTNNAEDPVGSYAGSGSAGQMYDLLNEAVSAMSIHASRSDWRIIVCKIIPKFSGGFEITNVRAFNQQLEEMMFSGGLRNDPVTLIDMYSLLSPGNFTGDGIHPNASGYDLMARLYAGTIRGSGSTDGIITPDSSPPATISGLQAAKANDETALLTWIAPGDNGNSGKATLYELRYSTDSQLMMSNPSAGRLYSLDRPLGAGSLESRLINLPSGSKYYFRLRTYDEQNNVSGWSDLASADLTLTAGGNIVCDSLQVDTNWSYTPGYQIGGGKLSKVATNGWSGMAIFTGATYSYDANFVETSITWASDAVVNTRYTGVAMLLDSNNPSAANGYMIRLDATKNTIDLYRIINGAFQFYSSAGVVLANAPAPGDDLAVRFTQDVTGYSFQVSLNNSYLGKLTDKSPVLPQVNSYYSGVILFGATDGQNNKLSRFCLEIPVGRPELLAIVSGDSTSSKVNTSLPLPLKVKVTDVNGFGVKGVPVEFTSNSPNVSLSTDYEELAKTFNGDIWLEAENGILESPMSPASSPDASEGKFILGQGSNDEGYARYNFLVPKAGVYKVWIRGAGPDDNSNSCYVGFDLASANNLVRFSNNGTYEWKQSISQSLSAGIVDFYVRTREAGTQIDKILITLNANTPVGKGNSNQQFPNVTDEFGFAYSEATFGTQSGWFEITASTKLIDVGGEVTFTVNALPDAPAKLEAASPLRLAGNYSSPLPQPFQVQLVDQYGNPAQRTPVTFRIISGSGYFGSNSSNTEVIIKSDPDGIAGATLTMGSDSLTQVEAIVTSRPELGRLVFEGVIQTIASGFEFASNPTPQGTVGQMLPQPLQVAVKDGQSNPVANYMVQFSVTAGNGIVANDTTSGTAVFAKTGANGIASVTYRIGNSSGQGANQVTASSGFSSLKFDILAAPDAANSIVLIGDNQQQFAGQTFDDSLKARVVDRFGNGIPGHILRFTVVQGDGNFENITGTSVQSASKDVVTNSQGRASVMYTAGKMTGVNKITVQDLDSGISPAQFSNIVVNETTVSRIQKTKGDNQSGTVKAWLSDSLVVKLFDPFDGPVKNVRVVFEAVEPQESPGQFANGTVYFTATSRSNGTAAARFRLGERAVTHLVRVSTPDVKNVTPVVFTLWAEAGPAAKLQTVNSANFQGIAGVDTVELQVKVIDVYDNPVAGEQVLFNIESGGGSFTNGDNIDTTDTNGTASVRYVMGQIAGSVKINVYVPNLSPVSFFGTILAGPAVAVQSTNILPLQGLVNSTLATPFQIILRDMYGNPVPNAAFTCKALSVGGSVVGDSIKFSEANGTAAVFYKLGTKAGSNSDTLRLAIPGHSGQFFDFYATALPGEATSMSADTTYWGPLKIGAVPIVLQPKVSVMDRFGNRVQGHKIKFYDKNAAVRFQTQTDEQGIAAYRWVLEAKPDSQIVFAATDGSKSLQGEPIAFSAVTVAGTPNRIEAAGATQFNGPAWLQVRVVDENTVPVSGFGVDFKSNLAGRFFSGADTSVGNIRAKTNSEGIAKAYYEPLIGNNIISTSSSQPQLSGPNFLVKGLPATATQISLVNTSTTIADTVGKQVTIQVQARGNTGAPAPGQTISFEIVTGNGLINGNGTSTQQSSGPDGLASVTWTLGRRSGNASDRLRISAERNGAPLDGSPIIITANTAAGSVFADSSTINAEQGIAGINTLVDVVLKDRYGNPAQTRQLQLVEHPSLSLAAPIAATDESGRTVVWLVSQQAGLYQFQLKTTGLPSILLNPAQVEIKPAAATRLAIVAGNGQKANPGAVLKEPLVVRTMDSYNNPVGRTNVVFSSAAGKFADNGQKSIIVQSDSMGIAAVAYIAGNSPGAGFQVMAQLGGSTVQFSGNINSSISKIHLIKITPDTLGGKPGETVGPFMVRVIDGDSIAVWNRSLAIDIDPATGGSIEQSNYASDEFGEISFYYTVGNRKDFQPITVRDSQTGSRVSFAVATQAGAPSRIEAIQPTEPVEVTEILALTAMVTDSLGAGVPGIAVQFSLLGEENYNARFLEETVRHTDTGGKATILFKTGEKAKQYRIKATSSALPQATAIIVVETVHRWPSGLVEKNNYRFGKVVTAGRELLEPIVITAVDEYENPVDGVKLNFIATGNNGSFAGYTVSPNLYFTETGSDGTGNCRWIIGKTGTNTIDVRATYLGNALPPLTITATGVANNFPLFENVPEDTVTLDYTEYYFKVGGFTQHIEATDADNDPMEYVVEVKPSTATYNQETHQFSWKPGPTDKSTIWHLRIIARDNKQGIEQGTGVYEAIYKIIGNMAPRVTTAHPDTNESIWLNVGDSKNFWLEVEDIDGDPVFYNWEFFIKDGGIVRTANSSSFTLSYEDFSLGFYELLCHISDGQGNTRTLSWSAIKVKVELSLFEAKESPFEGIVVNWHTTFEEENVGFNLLRSLRKEGPYKKINTGLIERNRSGNYSFIDSTAEAGVKYFYKLQDMNKQGFTSDHGPISVEVSVPASFDLSQNYPNPFNPETSIRFQLPRAAQTQIVIYNIAGQEVRRLIDNQIKAGYHIVRWDGRDSNGLPVGSGIYYYRMVAGDYTSVRKMVLIH